MILNEFVKLQEPKILNEYMKLNKRMVLRNDADIKGIQDIKVNIILLGNNINKYILLNMSLLIN